MAKRDDGMDSYSYTTIQAQVPPDMTWLIGRTINKVEKLDYSWFFVLNDGGSIATESPWRLVTSQGIVVTSEDHGHPFGLPAPVNAVVWSLGEIGPNAKTAVPALTESLKDKECYVRSDAALALREIGPEARTAIPALTELLNDKDQWVQLAAAEGVAKIGADPKPAALTLTELLKHKDANVRHAAAGALRDIGPEAKTAIPTLTELLKDKDERVRKTAAEALKQITNSKTLGSSTPK